MASTSTTPGNTSSTGPSDNTDTHTPSSSMGGGERMSAKNFSTESIDPETGSKTITGTNTTYGSDGEQTSKTMYSDVYDEKGNLETSVTHFRDSEGNKTRIEIDGNGNTTTTKTDKDGNVTSKVTTDADGNPVEDTSGDTEFWDVDIIYGDHDEMFVDRGGEGHLAAKDMVPMIDEMASKHEEYVDHFDFIM